MTARWVVDEIVPARGVRVIWQPISLYFKNKPDEGSPVHDRLFFTHRLLRVMESIRAVEGDSSVQAFYWECGRRIHHDQSRDFTALDVVESAGIDPTHADAFDDDKWDAEIRTRMDAGLAVTGEDVGTPIIAFDDRGGVKQGYFGPVITRVPSHEDSLAMWDALIAMMNIDGFWELKRTRTDPPEFPARP